MADSAGLKFTKASLSPLAENLSDSAIGKMHGVTASAIKYWRHRLNIPTRYVRHKLPVTREEWIALTETASDPELARRFGVHKNAIREWRIKFQIPAIHRLKRRKTYQINENFFSKIETEEQAYILGFFCGDGNVHTRGRSASISLKDTDEEILLKIRSAMTGNMPIHHRKNDRGFSTESGAVILDINRKKIADDLAILGIHPAKTYSLRYPVIPQALDRHFIRGLWDADGSVSRWNFSLCGASLLIFDVLEKIQERTGIIISKHPTRKFLIWGSRHDKPVIDWLYSDATIFLKRKHLSYLKHWK